MTDIIRLPQSRYRLLVAIRYLNASDEIFKGLRTQCGINDFHFLITLRCFIEYTRREIWFLAWASEEKLRLAEHLTFNRSGSPNLLRMDEMISESLGQGRVSHLNRNVPGIDEPFLNCLHALTHGNPISVRFLGIGLGKIFQTDKLLSRAEADLDLFRILVYRRAAGEDLASLWTMLAKIANRPEDLKANARIAASMASRAGLESLLGPG